MTAPLRVTVVADGSSDEILVEVVKWVLVELGVDALVQWADPYVCTRTGTSLREIVKSATALYPADVLFVHRDAEKATIDERVREIRDAVDGMPQPFVCVVPVRMTEAWFLFDDAAIRRAADNPNGSDVLPLPGDPEALVDPKEILHEALRVASGLPSRRRKKFHVGKAQRRLPHHIESYAPLRRLEAFSRFEEEAARVISSLGQESA